jgi:hypothetical protein
MTTVTFRNSRGQPRTRQFITNEAFQDWLRTVADEVIITLITRS